MTPLEIGDHFVIRFNGEQFEQQIAAIIIRLNEFTLTYTIPHRSLSGAGRWAYRFCRWLGVPVLDALAWLETCPGAFVDELGEGWQP